MSDARLEMAWDDVKKAYASVRPNLESAQKKIELISKIFFSLLQIFAIILLGLYLAMLANLIWDEPEGITIATFDTSGVGGECSGKAMADRLGMEMMRINEIHEYKEELINTSSNVTKMRMIPFAKSEWQSEDYSQAGNVNLGLASVPLGQLIQMLKATTGRSGKTITGSLEIYGSTINIIAFMKDNESIRVWERSMLSEDRSLIEENIPELTRDLAYNIVHDMSRTEDTLDPHKTWVVFKYLIEGWDAYRDYNTTGNIDSLDRAMLMIEDALSVEPESPELKLLIYHVQAAYQVEGRGTERSMDATGTPKLSGDDWYNTGVVLFGQGSLKEAAEAFDKAIDIDPDNDLYWVSSSFVLNKLGSYEKALDSANSAIRLNSSCADAWHEKGIALDGMRRYDEAEQAYLRAIELDDSKWYYYYDYALLLQSRNRTKDAIEMIDTGFSQNSDEEGSNYLRMLHDNILQST